MVFPLSSGIKEWWRAQNGKGQPASEILFRVCLERWRRWPCDVAEVPNFRSTERYRPGGLGTAKRGQQDQAICRNAPLMDSHDLDLRRRGSPLRIELRRSPVRCAPTISCRQQIGMVA